MFLAASCCVCGSSPFRGCSNRGWRGMFAMQSWEGGRLVEAGACGGRPGQAPQLSNHPGPAGSCNSCPSHLFPPCRLPPPTAACRAVGAACTLGPAVGGGGAEALRAWRPGVEREGLPWRDQKYCHLSRLGPERGGLLPKVTQGGTTKLGHALDSYFFVAMAAGYNSTQHGGDFVTQMGHSESQRPFPN